MIRLMIILVLALSSSTVFADSFSGRFVGDLDGDRYTLSMQKNADGSYAGVIEAGGERVRLVGLLRGQQLIGTIYEEGDSYGFTASVQSGGGLLLTDEDGESVAFSREGSTVDSASRQPSSPATVQSSAVGSSDYSSASAIEGVSKVYINRIALKADRLSALQSQYGVRIQSGRYWYDARSGAWGLENGPTVGFIQAGLNLPGPMPASISGGGTHIFINGREIHPIDQRGLQALFGVTYPGRYWLDARGNLGLENGPALVNIAAQIRQNQARQSGSVTHGYNSGYGARGTLGGGMYSGRTASGKSVFWYPGM